MSTITTTSLQYFSSLVGRHSSNSISNEYKRNLYLANLAREDRRITTQNSVENLVEIDQKGKNVPQVNDEGTVSQDKEYPAPPPQMNTSIIQANSAENHQTYDNTINRLKAKINNLRQELISLNRAGSNQQASLHQENETEKLEADAVNFPLDRPMVEESPLTSVLKRQITEIEQEIIKQRSQSVEEDINPSAGLNVTQLRQKKTRLEQQLKNLGNEASKNLEQLHKSNFTTTEQVVEKQGDEDYQNQREALRIKQELRYLENEITVLERQYTIEKTEATLKKTSEENNTTSNHLIDVQA
jgi:hypothetical protein